MSSIVYIVRPVYSESWVDAYWGVYPTVVKWREELWCASK